MASCGRTCNGRRAGFRASSRRGSLGEPAGCKITGRGGRGSERGSGAGMGLDGLAATFSVSAGGCSRRATPSVMTTASTAAMTVLTAVATMNTHGAMPTATRGCGTTTRARGKS